ncbi:zinc-dependent metalloprotease [Flavihumibacter sp. RY-1]|uniref:Zinc-dependent metalloprotease n=1 Tax=Flavihumibacter fluminis TaxID=2909236 RepID=A0ABS9BKX7_9BACT|nr:zinc-dependent metalloprotease [Flavihumibacter fluminis]MCF1716353.1 zinc-dependent metalloprotease [Flavihumibacter fluminis]
MKYLFLTVAIMATLSSYAQKKKVEVDSTEIKAAKALDSILNGVAGKPKKYNEIITEKAVTQKGFFHVHAIDQNYYWEIPKGMLGREMLIVSRFAKTPVNGILDPIPYYPGDQLNERIVTFEKGPDNKIFLRTVSSIVRSSDSSGNGMYKSVQKSSLRPILMAFPIKAFNEKDSAAVIDVTDLISNDHSLMTIPALFRPKYKLGVFAKDRSYVISVKPFSRNLEIRTLKTYMSLMDPGGDAATFEFATSLVLLPEKPMKPRMADSRVGYFAGGYVDFDGNPQGVKETYFINRWRLEPKKEDMVRYFAGELVEPEKPIIIYIDPSTPKKWVPYLIQGVNDWQAAFEKAGFKNAIIAKEAPENDSTWSLEDAMHSAIVYKPSLTPNAMGPHVNDPRSGEILETHIHWYHNVMALLRNWYMIQAGAIDPRARKLEFDDDLMGQLIRFVSSHEVGHTLGLAHNFGSSASVPVDSLRDKKWVEENGHTPSIMDYARFNYVAQPEDNISPKGIFPRIGDYDKWAIEWGYRYLPEFKSKEEEQTFMNNWIINATKNKRLVFGAQTVFTVIDPRNQNEDLGDDVMKANKLGIKNLKKILPQLPKWTMVPNQGHGNLKEMYSALVSQYLHYATHVINSIGGYYTDSKTAEQGGKDYRAISKSKQKNAMTWLKDEVFITPKWLLDRNVIDNIDPTGKTVHEVGMVTLSKLMTRMLVLVNTNRMFDSKENYELIEFLNDMKSAIWSEITTAKAIDSYRRDLQTFYITNLLGYIKHPMFEKPDTQTGDFIALLNSHAQVLLIDLQIAQSRYADPITRSHLRFNIDRLKKGLDPNANLSIDNRVKTPGFNIDHLNKSLFSCEH